MTLNRNQILAIIIAVLAVLMASTAQLTDLFGQTGAKYIISAAGLLNGVLSAILAVITGQAGMVKDVAAMPGVEPIRINAQANQTLARVAMDPTVDKVMATSMDANTVAKTAES